MKQFAVWKGLYLSFYSRDFYRDVVKNWNKSVFGLLFISLFLACLPVIIIGQNYANKNIPPYIAKIVPQVPVMTIKNGKMSTPLNQVYLIKDPDDAKELIAVIDTTGQYQNLEQYPELKMLITSKEFMLRDKDSIRIYQFDPTLTTDIDPKVIQAHILKLLPWLGLIWLPFALVFTFLYRCIMAFFYSFLGLLMNLVLKAELTYFSIYQLALTALTPVIIVNTFIYLISPQTYSGWMMLILALGYLLFGIHSNSKHAD